MSGFLDYTGLSYFWQKIKSALVKKQDSFSVGDGLTLADATLQVTTPVKGVTQAEYNALTEQEKNSRLYVVTDANIDLNDRGEVYSTEETRIGTWIDGKPLYRKTVVSTILSGQGQILAQNVDTVVDAFGTAIIPEQVSNTTIYIVPEYASTDDLVILSINSGTVSIVSKGYPDYSITMTLKYTKTTDAAPTSQTNLLASEVNSPDVPPSVSYAPASASSAQLNL